MAGLQSIIPLISTGIELIGSISSQGQSSSSQDEYRLQERQASITRIQKTEAIEQDRRRERLRRALATSRARLGSQGVGSARGSGEAVLRGLLEEGKETDGEERDLSQGRIDDINRRYRRNLLESAEARSRQRLDALKKFTTLIS